MAESGRSAALAGVLATAAGLGASHLAAAVVAPAASPVVAVWQRAVDLTPAPLKEWAVATLGTADKVVLLAGIVVVTLGLGALLGLVARRSLAVAVALGGVLALVALLAALPAGHLDAVPAVVAFGVAAGSLLWLRGGPRRTEAGGLSRRRVLGVAGGAALAAVAGRFASAGRPGPTPGAAGPTPPVPTGPATPLLTGLESVEPELSRLFTPASDFFRIDTVLTPPRVAAADWTLTIDGLVDAPLTLTWPDLVALAPIERDVTLACVSNDVGGGYIGNARWRGVPTADLLRRVGVRAEADQVLSRSVDGFTVGTPLEALTDDRGAMLAYAMNGVPLPPEHGYPVRLLTPGLYGFVGATKWIVAMTVTTYARDAAYWTKRGWATDAPVLPGSRIEIPREGTPLPAGPVKVGGVAWAHGAGVGRVEVSVDGGPWTGATLGPDAGVMSWRQWLWTWPATPGDHVLTCRVVDTRGREQSIERSAPFPSGASGLHAVRVTVR